MMNLKTVPKIEPYTELSAVDCGVLPNGVVFVVFPSVCTDFTYVLAYSVLFCAYCGTPFGKLVAIKKPTQKTFL
jgi:hypothetical protein